MTGGISEAHMIDVKLARDELKKYYFQFSVEDPYNFLRMLPKMHNTFKHIRCFQTKLLMEPKWINRDTTKI